MAPSSSSVQHHEHFNVFSQLCLAIQLKNLLSCRIDKSRRANMERKNLAWLPNRDTRNLVALTPNRSSLLPSSSCTLQSPWREGASCSSLGPGSTGRLVAKGSSVSNAQTWTKCGKQTREWTKAQGNLWQDPTNEPPAKNWPTTTFPYRQTIGRLWKGSLRNVRRKLGLPEQHTMGPNFINEAIWGTLQMLVCGPLRASTRIRKRINVFFETQISPIFSQCSQLRRTGSTVWTIRKYHPGGNNYSY